MSVALRAAKAAAALALAIASAAAIADGATYYILPGGTGGAGTLSSPWHQFSSVFNSSKILQPGDTLVLMNGTYTGSTTGLLSITCGTNANNGTALARVTITAQNERQALIQGDGSGEPFRMADCSYWTIQGLHVADGDFASPNASDQNTAAMDFESSSNLLIRRNIVEHPNRCFNNNAMLLSATTDSVVEQNEVYFFHRWGIQAWRGSTNLEVRQNYANPRGAYMATNTACTTDGFGPGAFGPYFSDGNTFENNIAESNHYAGAKPDAVGFDVEATASYTKMLGNVSLNLRYVLNPHSNMTAATGNVWTDDIMVNDQNIGFEFSAGTFSVVNHASVFGTPTATTGVGLVVATGNAPCGYTEGFSYAVDNSRVENVRGAAYRATCSIPATSSCPVSACSSGFTFNYDHDDAYNNVTNYNPDQNVINSLTSDPDTPVNPSCYLWLPDGSPLKGKASDGGDVGATVLYQYSGGALTSNRLWDPATGAPLFAGAKVANLNDIAGDSLFDIAARLHVNQGGCAFPASYASAQSAPPRTPAGFKFK